MRLEIRSYSRSDWILSKLKKLIDAYGQASIADLCEITEQVYTPHDFSKIWTDVTDARTMRDEDGKIYLILPEPVESIF